MVNIKPNDLEVLWVAPEALTDERVPTAQELAASSHLHQQNLGKASAIALSAGVRNRPVFGVAANRSVVIPQGLSVHAPGHPSIANFANDVTIQLPALADTSSTISRYDRIYLACFGVVVDAGIDSDIVYSFEWANQSGVIQTRNKENTRRIRSVWALVWGAGTITASDFYTALPLSSGNRQLTVTKAAVGAAIGSYRVYPLDPNLIDTKVYTVLSDTIVMIDLCRVWRVQNLTQTGYVWGRNGEVSPFEADVHIQPSYKYVGDGHQDWGSRARETFRRVTLGLSLPESPTFDRAVLNLLNGQVAANLDAPGVAAAAPNGSVCLANSQRTTFTNEALIQKNYCLPVITSDAAGVAQASVPFQVNSPAGSFFSQNLADHRVFNANGLNITADGTITGLGSTGALIWTAKDTSVVAPGDLVYVVPGIFYPAGSGFSYTGTIEKVFRDTLQLNTANVRTAAEDISAYTAPASGETFLVVVGRERAALHRIYKKLTVTSTSGGVVAIPNNERGVIAFISGPNAPTGRQDKPVIAGLNNSTSYDVLIYHPPGATENWQFQFKTSRYAGTSDRAHLDGATVVSAPFAIAHTQGGGNSVFLADGELQFEPIAFRLPANTLSGAVQHFQANYRIQFVGENDLGFTSIREVGLLPGAGASLPRVGQVLTAAAGANAQSRGISCAVTAGGLPLGCVKVPIRCSQVYQLAIAFLVEKGGVRRLCVVTLNQGSTNTPTVLTFNTDSPSFAGIDCFNLY